jgi:catechol 2,3-dioxygenase-like lactoylglutathione lyase family enzyme
MPATATTTAVKFHIGLHVSDLDRSIHFYRTLLGTEPAKHYPNYAKFEPANPPLVLALIPSPQAPGGSLNHLGIRLPDAAALVEVQRRLEEAGLPTQRQEGVECCYARQTKFWVTDPDHNLIEVYIFEEDLDHSGFDDPPAPHPQSGQAPAVVWEHRLTEPVPERIGHPDGSVDEVRLEGTFNTPMDSSQVDRLLAEVRRVLRPGGKAVVHALVGDRPFPGTPHLPGLASLVGSIPTGSEVLEALRQAGFAGLFYEKLGDIHCFQAGGVELREMRLCGWKAEGEKLARQRAVLYKGPFDQVVDEEGTTFPRGEQVPVTAGQWEVLQKGPAADQFLFFAEEKS